MKFYCLLKFDIVYSYSKRLKKSIFRRFDIFFYLFRSELTFARCQFLSTLVRKARDAYQCLLTCPIESCYCLRGPPMALHKRVVRIVRSMMLALWVVVWVLIKGLSFFLFLNIRQSMCSILCQTCVRLLNL